MKFNKYLLVLYNRVVLNPISRTGVPIIVKSAKNVNNKMKPTDNYNGSFKPRKQVHIVFQNQGFKPKYN